MPAAWRLSFLYERGLADAACSLPSEVVDDLLVLVPDNQALHSNEQRCGP